MFATYVRYTYITVGDLNENLGLFSKDQLGCYCFTALVYSWL